MHVKTVTFAPNGRPAALHFALHAAYDNDLDMTRASIAPHQKFELVHIVERIELFCVSLCLDSLKGNDERRVKHTDPFDKDLWIPHRHMRSNGGSIVGDDTKRPVNCESIW
jgi:hypothetical protein